jgi:hypothetical protein
MVDGEEVVAVVAAPPRRSLGSGFLGLGMLGEEEESGRTSGTECGKAAVGPAIVGARMMRKCRVRSW